MAITAISRRKLLKNTALIGAGAIAAPYVRGAHAAGKITCGFWDHWVPGANNTLTKLCKEWGEKETMTIAAEGQARSGHDILQHPTWYPADYAEQLEPMDDLMQKLLSEHG